MHPIKLIALSLLVVPSMGFAVSKPVISPLPKNIPRTTQNKGECIRASELVQFEKWVDSRRITLSTCNKGVIPPSKVILSRMPYKAGTSGSIYECTKVRENHFNSRQIDMFLEELSAMAGEIKGLKDPKASCAANMLYTWAKASAMSVLSSEGDKSQAEKDRMWTVAGLSSVYLFNEHIQAAAERMSVGSKTKDDYIRSWFSDLSYGAKERHDELLRANHEYAYVNTQFWRAYSMLPTAILNRDATLLAASRKTFLLAMQEIDDSPELNEYDKGFLPRELYRLSKSLHYHEFALYPLLGMAVVSRAYGCDFANSSWRHKQLARLLRKTLEGFQRSQVFESAVKDYVGRKVTLKRGGGPKTLLLLSAAVPGGQINSNVISFVKKYTGADIVVKDSSFPRLGGKLSALVEASVRLSKKKSSKLKESGLCEGN